MVRWWWGAKAVAPVQFETQQEKLRRLSKSVIEQYKEDLDEEIADPERLRAMYGSSFASADGKRQAEVVCLMATSMLSVPNADVSMVTPQCQESIASVRDGVIVEARIYDIETSFCKHVIATGRELAIELAAQHPLVCDTTTAMNGEVVSYLGVPVASREGIIIGVLCVHSPLEREWKAADVTILTQLSFVLTRALKDPEAQ